MGEEISENLHDSEEEFNGIYIDDGYVIVEFNPWWKIPLAVVIGKLKAAGVAITTSTIKAGALLMVAGKRITKANVDRVIRAWPTIRKALIRAGIGICLWALGNVTWSGYKAIAYRVIEQLLVVVGEICSAEAVPEDLISYGLRE